MAPFYFIGEDELLISQLNNLKFQTDKKFEVVVPDPHYEKRGWLTNFAKTLNYNFIHFPYVPNLKTPKSFDYGILNNAVLMTNTNKIITFQDWRFCHPKLIKILRQVSDHKFIGFNWQVLYKDACDGVEWDGKRTTHHKKSTINISVNDAVKMYETGFFANIPWEASREKTFNNSCWGHYCINKDLWMQVNGIDEVATNTRHYADLDLNARLEELFKSNNMHIEIPMIKNVMVRMMHNKGLYFGGSNIPLNFEVNNLHKNCCFIDRGSMNDKKFVLYTIQNINNGKFTKLYETKYSEHFVRHNTNEALDTNHATIGFQCNDCHVIAETPHWYEKSPNARIKSLIGIGKNGNKIGRNLNIINELIKNKSFEEKVSILENSWYEDKFFNQ
jgi:hypothetical protein